MKNEGDRLLAIKILQPVFQHKGSLSTLKDKITDKHNSAFVQELCYGVCRHYHQLAFISSKLINKPLRKKDTDLQCLVYLGLYQLIFMRTPAHAAINETVAVVKALKKDWAKGLINAVLREFQRQHETLQPLIDSNFNYKFSHPDWLITALKQSWPKHYQQILQANNERAPMTLRLNFAHETREEYLHTLTNASILAQPGTLANTAIVLEQAVPVHQLPGFEKGVVSVQDEASQLCAELLQLTAGQRVLDACAAPGGKTCAILEAEPKLAELVAIDNEQKRLNRVQENLDRTGLTATLHCADINQLDQWWDGKAFDRVLLDVPCSATGVIRRHPDIKLLRREKDIAELKQKQMAILNTAWQLLKPGGILLYSTCSVLLEENSHQISTFIDRNSDASPIEIDSHWGLPCQFGKQLLPGSANQDGFYFALLQKC